MARSSASSAAVTVANELSNLTYNLFAGGSMTVDNTLVAVSANTARLAPAATLNLNSATFNYIGSTVATITTAQTVATLNFGGGNIIGINRQTGVSDIFTATALNQVGNGTITFNSTAGSLYGSATTQFKSGSLAAPTGGAPMIGAYYVSADVPASPVFVTYATATGIADATVTTAATAAAIQALTNVQIGDVTVAATLTGAANPFALRIGNVALAGAFTVTLQGDSTVANGAGLILNSTTAQTDAVNFTFGAGGNREGYIFVNTAGIATTLSGVLTTTVGLTKFGPGILSLTGANSGTIGGTIAINQGNILAATPAELGTNLLVATATAPAVSLNGGTLDTTGGASGNYLNAITVTGDSTLTDSATTQSRFGSLAFAARSGGVTDPTVLTFSTGGAVFTGGLTLTGAATFQDAATTSANSVVIEGALSGAGALNKFGAGTVQLAGVGTGASGNVTVYGGLLQSLNGTAAAAPSEPAFLRSTLAAPSGWPALGKRTNWRHRRQ